ncbi:MAG: hypothetical protein HUU21_24580 [Polyangiaceae bacterium]|nr:hypothetical protein [Polyangiaceae bacterium]
MSLREVTVTLAAVSNGRTALVRAYPNDDGNRYIVPLYDMTVSGTDDAGSPIKEIYDVIRFGVQRDVAKGVSKAKMVGLYESQSHVLRRVGYLGGSWQIKGGHLIHDGADEPMKQAWGQIGCLEVVGKGQSDGGVDRWQEFEALMLKLSGAKTAEELGSSGKAQIVIHASPIPPLKKYP